MIQQYQKGIKNHIKLNLIVLQMILYLNQFSKIDEDNCSLCLDFAMLLHINILCTV